MFLSDKHQLQLKKLELIRLLSDQLLQRKRLGVDVYLRGTTEGIRTSSNSNYTVSLYELLKSYSNHQMRKNFQSINIPKLPVCTTELGVEIIKKNIQKLHEWKDISELIPRRFKKSTKLKNWTGWTIFSFT